MAVLQYRTLSNRTVAALTVERDTVFWDRELTGFGVRVYPTGGKVYVAQARGPDGPKRVTVGRCPVLGAEQARQRAALIIARVKAGEDPVPLPLAAKFAGVPTVADLARRYLEEHVAVRCKPKTARTARSVVNRHIVPALGRLPLARGGTPARHGAAREPVRDPRDGEYDGRDADAHVCPRQGLGHGAGRLRPVPVHPDEPQAQARAVPDRRRVHPPRPGAGRGFGQGQPGIGRRGGDHPPAHADGLPQKRNPDPALGACRSTLPGHFGDPGFSNAGGPGLPEDDRRLRGGVPASRPAARIAAAQSGLRATYVCTKRTDGLFLGLQFQVDPECVRQDRQADDATGSSP